MEYLVPAILLLLLAAVAGLVLRSPGRRPADRAGSAACGAGRPDPPPGSRRGQATGHRSVLVVAPPPRPFWDERGWQRWRENGCTLYAGEYRARERQSRQMRRFPGYIRVRGCEVDTYIASPPSTVRYHPKGPCFQYVAGPWFRVHWHRPPRNADEAILYVEQVLDEAINGTAARP
ncbi:MAG: hypothetical protein ACP5SI_03735 [Chloroflexia bacterium]